MELLLKVLPWVAVISLPLGYWKQVWHIHKHKEVRDLDLSSYVFFIFTYISLLIESIAINSDIFIWKNILAIVPVIVIIVQVISNRDKKWVDDQYEKLRDNQQCTKVQMMHKNINRRGKHELSSTNAYTTSKRQVFR